MVACDESYLSPLLKHCPPLHHLFTRQRKPLLYRSATQNPPRHIFPHRRSMLETVPRSAANKPTVVHLRMLVDQKISIPRIFVLANPRLHNRPPPYCRAPPPPNSSSPHPPFPP